MSWRNDQFSALFDPAGIIVAGASTHPGKFGFVVLHNIISCGYQGNLYATNREGSEVLGRETLRSISEVPDGSADLLFVCTPAATNVELLKEAAAKGVRAAFIASAVRMGKGWSPHRRHSVPRSLPRTLRPGASESPVSQETSSHHS